MSTITYRGQDYNHALVNASIQRIASQHNGEISREFSTGVNLTFPLLLDAVEFVKTCGVFNVAVLCVDANVTYMEFDKPSTVSLTHLGYLMGADQMRLPI